MIYILLTYLALLGSAEFRENLPAKDWAKLYRSLRNYLRPPGESGEGNFINYKLYRKLYRSLRN
jgi:hypothetical protein